MTKLKDFLSFKIFLLVLIFFLVPGDCYKNNPEYRRQLPTSWGKIDAEDDDEINNDDNIVDLESSSTSVNIDEEDDEEEQQLEDKDLAILGSPKSGSKWNFLLQSLKNNSNSSALDNDGKNSKQPLRPRDPNPSSTHLFRPYKDAWKTAVNKLTAPPKPIVYFMIKRMANNTFLERTIANTLYNTRATSSSMPQIFKNFVDFHYNVSTYTNIPWQTFGQSCDLSASVEVALDDTREANIAADGLKFLGWKPGDQGWAELENMQELLASKQIQVISAAIEKAFTWRSNREMNHDEDRFPQDPELEVTGRVMTFPFKNKQKEELEKKVNTVKHQLLTNTQFRLNTEANFEAQKSIFTSMSTSCSPLDYLICIPSPNHDPILEVNVGRCGCRDGFEEQNHNCYVSLYENCNRNNLFLSDDLKVLPIQILDKIQSPKCIANAECLNDFVCSSCPQKYSSGFISIIIMIISIQMQLISVINKT